MCPMMIANTHSLRKLEHLSPRLVPEFFHNPNVRLAITKKLNSHISTRTSFLRYGAFVGMIFISLAKI